MFTQHKPNAFALLVQTLPPHVRTGNGTDLVTPTANITDVSGKTLAVLLVLITGLALFVCHTTVLVTEQFFPYPRLVSECFQLGILLGKEVIYRPHIILGSVAMGRNRCYGIHFCSDNRMKRIILHSFVLVGIILAGDPQIDSNLSQYWMKALFRRSSSSTAIWDMNSQEGIQRMNLGFRSCCIKHVKISGSYLQSFLAFRRISCALFVFLRS